MAPPNIGRELERRLDCCWFVLLNLVRLVRNHMDVNETVVAVPHFTVNLHNSCLKLVCSVLWIPLVIV